MKNLLFFLFCILISGCSSEENPPKPQIRPAKKVSYPSSVFYSEMNGFKRNSPVVKNYTEPTGHPELRTYRSSSFSTPEGFRLDYKVIFSGHIPHGEVTEEQRKKGRIANLKDVDIYLLTYKQPNQPWKSKTAFYYGGNTTLLDEGPFRAVVVEE